MWRKEGGLEKYVLSFSPFPPPPPPPPLPPFIRVPYYMCVHCCLASIGGKKKGKKKRERGEGGFWLLPEGWKQGRGRRKGREGAGGGESGIYIDSGKKILLASKSTFLSERGECRTCLKTMNKLYIKQRLEAIPSIGSSRVTSGRIRGARVTNLFSEIETAKLRLVVEGEEKGEERERKEEEKNDGKKKNSNPFFLFVSPLPRVYVVKSPVAAPPPSPGALIYCRSHALSRTKNYEKSCRAKE